MSEVKIHRAGLLALLLLAFAGAPASGQVAPAESAHAEVADSLLHACFVPATGTIYRIGANGLSDACLSSDHAPFSWNSRGPAGQVGATGPQGEPGAQGAQGPSGPDGPQGAAGAAGLQGESGVTGPQGEQGAQGAAGPQGLQGQTGAAGPQGDQGATGSTGATGPQGLQGETGPIGPQGLTGEIGATGPQGLIGETGATGPQGLIGETGAIGPQGLPGETGAIGPQGLIGETGPQGVQGETGATGASGGISGIEHINGPSTTVSYYDTVTRTATCPSGKVVVGGGPVTSGSGSIDAMLNSSWASAPGTWSVTVTHMAWMGSGSFTLHAFAICATAG